MYNFESSLLDSPIKSTEAKKAHNEAKKTPVKIEKTFNQESI